MSAQLSLDLLVRDRASEEPRPRAVVPGAYNVFVAGLEAPPAKPCETCDEDARCVGPLPVLASEPSEAEATHVARSRSAEVERSAERDDVRRLLDADPIRRLTVDARG
ncbi:MAG: hypothetical protein BGO98_44980 [Myxococcales bacterium 68-20]|nr:MAG: hypothetical protein BGO98_44980 [Myxococcales bacterium 68-20]